MDTRLINWRNIKSCFRACCNYYLTIIGTFLFLTASYRGDNRTLIPIVLFIMISRIIYYRWKEINLVGSIDDYIRGVPTNIYPGFSNVNIMSTLGELNRYIDNVDILSKREEDTSTLIIDNVVENIDKPVNKMQLMIEIKEKSSEDYNKIEEEGYVVKEVLESLIEVSKISAGIIPVNRKILDINFLLNQVSMDFEEDMNNAELEFITNISNEELTLELDGEKISRVINILLANAIKHSKKGTRVYLDANETSDNYVISIKNISRKALNINYKDIFNDDNSGSGLQIEISRSIVELLGGKFLIIIDGDLFRTDIIFNRMVGVYGEN